ncbi:MAG: hypothetical protein SF002_07450 [Alphaproteobacteria bacterium]|nr:hypothetical protein [Alphaproteobacteria bacterium]
MITEPNEIILINLTASLIIAIISQIVSHKFTRHRDYSKSFYEEINRIDKELDDLISDVVQYWVRDRDKDDTLIETLLKYNFEKIEDRVMCMKQHVKASHLVDDVMESLSTFRQHALGGTFESASRTKDKTRSEECSRFCMIVRRKLSGLQVRSGSIKSLSR